MYFNNQKMKYHPPSPGTPAPNRAKLSTCTTIVTYSKVNVKAVVVTVSDKQFLFKNKRS